MNENELREITNKIKTSSNVDEIIKFIDSKISKFFEGEKLIHHPINFPSSITLLLFSKHANKIFNFSEYEISRSPFIRTLHKLKLLEGKTNPNNLIHILKAFIDNGNLNNVSSLFEEIYASILYDIPLIKDKKTTKELEYLIEYLTKYPVITRHYFYLIVSTIKNKQKKNSKAVLEIILEKLLNNAVQSKQNNHPANYMTTISYLQMIDEIAFLNQISLDEFDKSINALLKENKSEIRKIIEMDIPTTKTKASLGVKYILEKKSPLEEDQDCIDYLDISLPYLNERNILTEEYSEYQKNILNLQTSSEFNL